MQLRQTKDMVHSDSLNIIAFATTIRLRRIARLLPFDAIRREQKMNMSIFRRSRVVVVS